MVSNIEEGKIMGEHSKKVDSTLLKEKSNHDMVIVADSNDNSKGRKSRAKQEGRMKVNEGGLKKKVVSPNKNVKIQSEIAEAKTRFGLRQKVELRSSSTKGQIN